MANFQVVMSLGMLLCLIGLFGFSASKALRRPGWNQPMLTGLAVAAVIIAASQVWTTVSPSDATRRNDSELQVNKDAVAVLDKRIQAAKSAADVLAVDGRDPANAGSDSAAAKLWQARAQALKTEVDAIGEVHKSLVAARAKIYAERDAAAADGGVSKALLIVLAALGLGAVTLASLAFNGRAARQAIAARTAKFRSEARDPLALDDDVKALADAGRKIQAIVLYRAQTGAWLQDAKRAIESYSRGRMT
jgi:hypothetical protein